MQPLIHQALGEMDVHHAADHNVSAPWHPWIEPHNLHCLAFESDRRLRHARRLHVHARHSGQPHQIEL